VIVHEIVISTDLGGSSKHSSEKERQTIVFVLLKKNLKTEVEKGSITTVIAYG